MSKNNLEEKLLQSMEATGYSIDEVNMLGLSPVDAKRQMGIMMRRIYFDHSDMQIIGKIAQMKQSFIQNMYGATDCPFQEATKISWDAMFRKAHWSQEPFAFKKVHSWFHVAVSSAEYKDNVLYCSKDNTFPRFQMLFYHSGREMVQIEGERYTYGEAILRMRRFDHDGVSPLVAVSQPVFVIDERLLAQLLTQQEYGEVFQLLYTLYHISSHDGMLHGVFMDSSDQVKSKLSADSIGSRFLGSFDNQCLIYEINYLRLMKYLFHLSCVQKPRLRKDTELLYRRICRLTKDWSDVLGQYIRFIAFDRINRLIQTKPEKMFPQFVELAAVLDGTGKVFKSDWMWRDYLVHHSFKKQAVLFDGGPPVSYESMTKAMFDLY